MASIFRTPDGSWRAQVRRKHHPVRSANFETKQEAQRWARAQETEIDQRRRTPSGLRTSIADIIDRYLEEPRSTPLGRSKHHTITRLKAGLGHHRLEELTKQAILSYVQMREREGAGPVTVRADLSYLRTVLRFGGVMCDVEEAGVVAVAAVDATRDLLLHSRRVAQSRERSRRPSAEELAALEGFCGKRNANTKVPLWDLIQFARCTALRLGEICGPGGIVWEDVDVQSRIVTVRDRKDPRFREGNNSRIPLLVGPVVYKGVIVDPLEILSRQPGRSGRVFPFAEHAVSIGFTRLCRRAGVDDLHFHDLRHDGVSMLFEAGYQIQEVALISGHKTWSHLKRYTNLKPQDLFR